MLSPRTRVGSSSNWVWRTFDYVNDEIRAWNETTRIQFNWWLGENSIRERKGGELILFNVIIYRLLPTRDVFTRETITLNWPYTLVAKSQIKLVMGKKITYQTSYGTTISWSIVPWCLWRQDWEWFTPRTLGPPRSKETITEKEHMDKI